MYMEGTEHNERKQINAISRQKQRRRGESCIELQRENVRKAELETQLTPDLQMFPS